MKWLGRSLIVNDYLGVCISEKSYLKEMRELGINYPNSWLSADANATTHFLVNKDGKRATIVCIRPNQTNTGIQMAALIAHESAHVFRHYCDYIGEDRPSSEFEAYSIQAIFQELAEGYLELTDKAGFNRDNANWLIASGMRQLYDLAGIELPTSYDPKREVGRLAEALRKA